MLRTAALFLILFIHTVDLRAQGGIRAIFWEYNVAGKDILLAGLGLGYDHDMNERLSIGVDLRALVDRKASWALSYHSAYHFSDNDAGSFYLGPQVSMLNLAANAGDRMILPIGLRAGVRGGLERFYADLFGSVSLAPGASNVAYGESNGYKLSNIFYQLGLHLGWGWDRRR